MSFKVLILEDDRHLAESLKEFFTKQGATVFLAHSAESAEQSIAFQQYDLLMVDLVLPKCNGVDFLTKIIQQEKIADSTAIWVISAVLKSRVLPKNVFRKINEFFPKPLDLDKLKQKIQTVIHSQTNTVFHAFYMADSNDVSSYFNSNMFIEGHQLMFVYFHLFRRRFTGMLNLSGDNNNNAMVFFKDGRVNHIKMNDKSSYLGVLLVKKGLIASEYIKDYLKEDTNISLGEKLILNKKLTLGEVQDTVKEQMLNRLSKTMQWKKVKAVIQKNTQFSNILNQSSYLHFKNLFQILDYWVCSLVDIQWLKHFFHSNRHRVLQPTGQIVSSKIGPYSKTIGYILKNPFQTTTTVQEVINSSSLDESSVLRDLYARLLIRDCILKSQQSTQTINSNYSKLKNKLERDIQDLTQKNYFQRLGLSLSAKEQDIKEKYKQLVNMFHTDKQDSSLPRGIRELYEKQAYLMKESYDFLINKENRKQKVFELQNEHQYKYQNQYALGKEKLKNKQYKTAFKLLESCTHQKNTFGYSVLYCTWAYLKMKDSKLTPAERSQVNALFDKVSDKHKQSALFCFVKGLYAKRKGSIEQASLCFSEALSIDPNMKPAIEESFAVNKQIKQDKKKSLFSFFKKGA